jgi:hypothetical protein
LAAAAVAALGGGSYGELGARFIKDGESNGDWGQCSLLSEAVSGLVILVKAIIGLDVGEKLSQLLSRSVGDDIL